jgi:hypothetical protein
MRTPSRPPQPWLLARPLHGQGDFVSIRHRRSNRLSSSCRVQVRWRTSLSFPALTRAAHRASEPASRRCRQDRTLSTRANPALRQRQRPASSRGMGRWRHELSSLRRTKPTCKLARLVKKIGVRTKVAGALGPKQPNRNLRTPSHHDKKNNPWCGERTIPRSPLRVGSRPFGLATAVRCPSRIRSGPSCPRR